MPSQESGEQAADRTLRGCAYAIDALTTPATVTCTVSSLPEAACVASALDVELAGGRLHVRLLRAGGGDAAGTDAP